jgi:glyoxylase-like metal-dependent hydrolase (beta-lactamase superfamily II)
MKTGDPIHDYAIHLVRCSLPIPAASINVYFVREPIPTIIDAPPEGALFLDELDRGLQSIGSSLAEIKRIIITHPHFDHYGSAQSIRARSGAEIWAYGDGAHWIEHYEEEIDREDAYRRILLDRCGVPSSDIDGVSGYYREANRFGREATVSRCLSGGECFALGPTTFTVTHTPGHTPFCILLHDTDDRLAFTGDLLPPRLDTNPLVQWARIGSKEYRTTASYVASLEKVRAMNLEVVLPGHGSIIRRPAERIDGLLALIRRRRNAVLRVLEDDGPATPYEIARRLFPSSPRESLFRMVSDVMGQLQMLESQRLVGRSSGKLLIFRRNW